MTLYQSQGCRQGCFASKSLLAYTFAACDWIRMKLHMVVPRIKKLYCMLKSCFGQKSLPAHNFSVYGWIAMKLAMVVISRCVECKIRNFKSKVKLKLTVMGCFLNVWTHSFAANRHKECWLGCSPYQDNSLHAIIMAFILIYQGVHCCTKVCNLHLEISPIKVWPLTGCDSLEWKGIYKNYVPFTDQL